MSNGKRLHFWDYSIRSIALVKSNQAQLKYLKENKYSLNPDLFCPNSQANHIVDQCFGTRGGEVRSMSSETLMSCHFYIATEKWTLKVMFVTDELCLALMQ